ASGAQEEGDNTDDGGRNARGWLGGPLQHGLDRNSPFTTNQPLDLTNDFTPHRLRTECQAGNGDGDDENGCQGEEGIVREGRTHAGNIVVPPAGKGCLDHRPETICGQDGLSWATCSRCLLTPHHGAPLPYSASSASQRPADSADFS